jgi:chemotaxis response regulator CheB
MLGIGGSVGAIPALQTFFESMPPDRGMVFVVVLHLSPIHASNLSEMIQRWTDMRVLQAEDGIAMAENCVCVIPPGQHLAVNLLDRAGAPDALETGEIYAVKSGFTPIAHLDGISNADSVV